MASIFEDGVTPVDAALMDKLVKTDGSAQFQIVGYRIYYASGWNVDPSYGNTVSVPWIWPAWDNVYDRLTIDIAALSNASSEFGPSLPVVTVSPSYNTGVSGTDANHIPQAIANAVDNIFVRFFYATTGLHVTSIDTQMDFNMLIFGRYDT